MNGTGNAFYRVMDRRQFVAGVWAAFATRTALAEELPLIRAITHGPGFHWFGYYDKLQFDPTSRYVLGNRVSFQGRTPEPNDVIQLGMIDTQDGDRWIGLSESTAWSWQQGCMLQWVPGSSSEVIWNDREGDHFVSHVLDVKTRKKRTLPGPIYGLSPDGRWSVAPNFSRLADMRPGYGYAGVPDPGRDRLAPKDDGIWRMDLKTGKRTLIVPFAAGAAVRYRNPGLAESKTWFNHLLVAPDSKRFIFLHRWHGPQHKGSAYETRMFTANADGSDLYVLDPYGNTSHFIWRDSETVLAWATHPSHGDRFYLYRDKTDKVEVVGDGVMTVNGHCTYLPGNQWILNDTYPDKDRNQNPYLFRVKTSERVPLGYFTSPPEYTGEFRCDTHPRFSPDGKKVVIDSPHGGNGRQMYLIDISRIVTRVT